MNGALTLTPITESQASAGNFSIDGAPGDAGVVDQDVQLVLARERSAQCLHAFGRGHVALDGPHVAVRREFLPGRCQLLGLASRDVHARSAAQVGLRHGEAEARRTAGNHGSLARDGKEVGVRILWLVLRHVWPPD